MQAEGIKAEAFSPDSSRPATTIVQELATLQEEFGKVQSLATIAIADGTLSFLERSHLTIQLKGIQGRVAELLAVLG